MKCRRPPNLEAPDVKAFNRLPARAGCSGTSDLGQGFVDRDIGRRVSYSRRPTLRAMRGLKKSTYNSCIPLHFLLLFRLFHGFPFTTPMTHSFLIRIAYLTFTAVFKKVGTAKNKNRYHKFDHRLGLRPISIPQPCCRHIGLRIQSKNLPYDGTYKSYLVL